MRLYLSNLPSDVTETELKAIFEPFGEVTGATCWGLTSEQNHVGILVLDVEPQYGVIAAQALDRTMVRGREMRVHVIAPCELERPGTC